LLTFPACSQRSLSPCPTRCKGAVVGQVVEAQAEPGEAESEAAVVEQVVVRAVAEGRATVVAERGAELEAAVPGVVEVLATGAAPRAQEEARAPGAGAIPTPVALT
jgi:hypothetical protein